MKSTSSHQRGTRTTTKKMTSTATDQNPSSTAADSDHHRDHDDNDNNDIDDDLPNIIASLPTAFETVRAAPSKRPRMLGGRAARGTFGGGAKTTLHHHTTNTAIPTNDTYPEHEQENVTNRRLNSISSVGAESNDDNDDETNLLDLLNRSTGSASMSTTGTTGSSRIPSDLRPHLNRNHHHHPKNASHHHQRSESALPVLTARRSPFRLVRSSTTDVPPRPNFFSRRRVQRSHSMALNHHRVDEETNLDVWGEHHHHPGTTNPDHHHHHDGWDAIERADAILEPPRNTRRLFRARRHSWIPHSNPLTRSTSTTTAGTASSGSFSSVSMLQQQQHGSVSSFPNAIDELDVASSTIHISQPNISSTLLSHIQDDVTNMSPEPRSETSTSTGGCRKRGVSTSSISDLDDYLQLSGGSLSSYKRRHHALSSSLSESHLRRMFAVPPGQVMPPVPSLQNNDHHYLTEEDLGDIDFVTSSTSSLSSLGRHHHANTTTTTTHQRKESDVPAVGNRETARGLEQPAEAMDQDTSMEDNQENDASPDSSFADENDDDGTTGMIPSRVPSTTANVWAVEENVDTKLERVLETMPSIDDLTFLINELKNEERRNRNVMVGAGDMWKIAPPLQQWTSHRRTTFIHWATTSLGFIVRSAGMGYMFVIIHKKRGLQLMELLEQAHIHYQTTNPLAAHGTLHTTPDVVPPLFVTHPVSSLTPTTRGGNYNDSHSTRRGGPLIHRRYVVTLEYIYIYHRLLVTRSVETDTLLACSLVLSQPYASKSSSFHLRYR